MNIEDARETLKDIIQKDDGLYNLGEYLYWGVGDPKVVLDGIFSPRTLEAIVVYINHTKNS